MEALPIIGPIFGFFGKIVEAGAWLKVFNLATGDAFYASVVVGILAVLILALWRLPKLGGLDLSGFTGKVALCAVVGLIAIAALAFLMVVYNREVKERVESHGPPRALRERDPVKRPVGAAPVQTKPCAVRDGETGECIR